MRLAFRAGFTSTSSVSLNVNAIGAIALRTANDQAIGAGNIIANSVYEVIYHSSFNGSAGGFILCAAYGETNLSVAGGVTATGTVQGDAAQLTLRINKVTSGAANTGVILLATIPTGGSCTVANFTGNQIKIYPASGHQIDDFGANTATTVANRGVYRFEGVDSTSWLRTSFD